MTSNSSYVYRVVISFPYSFLIGTGQHRKFHPSLKLNCLSAFLPDAPQMPQDVLSYLDSRTMKYSIKLRLDAAHLPILSALFSMKSRAINKIYQNVFHGKITAEDAYKSVHCFEDLNFREKKVAQIGFLALGLNPDALDGDRNTVFHHAATLSDSQFMEGVLSFKKNSWRPPSLLLDQTNNENRTSLSLAVESGRTDFVRLLLKSGCSEVDRGWALVDAAKENHTDSVRLLLNSGCRDYHIGGALEVAAGFGHTDSVRLLLDFGCSEGDRKRALEKAVSFGHTACVKLLAKKKWSQVGFVISLVVVVTAVAVRAISYLNESTLESTVKIDYFNPDQQPFEEYFGK